MIHFLYYLAILNHILALLKGILAQKQFVASVLYFQLSKPEQENNEEQTKILKLFCVSVLFFETRKKRKQTPECVFIFHNVMTL